MITIPIIESNKNYWLVRTNGGKYYADFCKNNFIAINWDDITLNDISTKSNGELVQQVQEKYPKKINQVELFHN